MKTTLETEREAVTSPSLVLYPAPILAELSRETDAALRAESEARERRSFLRVVEHPGTVDCPLFNRPAKVRRSSTCLSASRTV
jgi:hypothetical protein